VSSIPEIVPVPFLKKDVLSPDKDNKTQVKDKEVLFNFVNCQYLRWYRYYT
jgi:hypothetical protein